MIRRVERQGAAAAPDLLTLAEAVRATGVTDTTEANELQRHVQAVSAAIAAHCRRHDGQASLLVRGDWLETAWDVEGAVLHLSRWPVESVASVTDDGVALAANVGYFVDAAAGTLVRLDAAGDPDCWDSDKVAVRYWAGYAVSPAGAQLAVPADLRQAAEMMLRLSWSARDRDPLLKSMSVDGVGSRDYWVGGVDGGAIPPDIAALLAPYAGPPPL